MQETINYTTTKDRGASLELAIEHIFSVAGFNTKKNKFIAHYEVDVLAEVGDRQIIIECKNYQNSTLTIRNLIHEWNSKNQIIRAHKIIIALAGLKISQEDYKIAAEFDIELWSQDDITEFFTLSLHPDKLRTRLIEKIDFRPLTIAERYRDQITYRTITPLLSNYIIPEEGWFRFFNKSLRAHILTELQMSETTAEERANLIELFEGSKTKKGFLNLIKKKRTEVEYWDTVCDQLKTTEILPKEKQEYYLGHMNDLLNEYAAQQNFFHSDDDYMKNIKKLISTRLQNALINGQSCSFSTNKMNNSVSVIFESIDSIYIRISNISEIQGNILNWIMTSQGIGEVNDRNEISSYRWICSSLDEATEKVYRIFTEFYEVNNACRLKDANII